MFRSSFLGFSHHGSLSHYYYHPSEVTPLPSFLVSYSSYLFNLNNFWVPCKKGMTKKYGYIGSISFTWTWCYDLSFDILLFWCWTWSIWWYDGMIMMLWLQVYGVFVVYVILCDILIWIQAYSLYPFIMFLQIIPLLLHLCNQFVCHLLLRVWR